MLLPLPRWARPQVLAPAGHALALAQRERAAAPVRRCCRYCYRVGFYSRPFRVPSSRQLGPGCYAAGELAIWAQQGCAIGCGVRVISSSTVLLFACVFPHLAKRPDRSVDQDPSLMRGATSALRQAWGQACACGAGAAVTASREAAASHALFRCAWWGALQPWCCGSSGDGGRGRLHTTASVRRATSGDGSGGGGGGSGSEGSSGSGGGGGSEDDEGDEAAAVAGAEQRRVGWGGRAGAARPRRPA